jgi:hypothetical protein
MITGIFLRPIIDVIVNGSLRIVRILAAQRFVRFDIGVLRQFFVPERRAPTPQLGAVTSQPFIAGEFIQLFHGFS